MYYPTCIYPDIVCKQLLIVSQISTRIALRNILTSKWSALRILAIWVTMLDVFFLVVPNISHPFSLCSL